MNVFKIIRLSVWSIILAIATSIALTYIGTSQTLLSPGSMRQVVKEAKLADTVREEVLLPKVLQTTQGSTYATLLDETTVRRAFDRAVSTEALNEKLTPAADALQAWLDSKEPDITFTITMSDVSDNFAEQLARGVDEKYASLPACTLRSSLADVENGICRSSLITKQALSEKIAEMVKTDPTLKDNVTLTPASVGMDRLSQGNFTYLPTYLNLWYALALIMTGVSILVFLWLLLKHRFAGMIAIGSAGLLTSIILFVISVISASALGTVSTNQYLQQAARSTVTLLETTWQQYALIAAGVGVGFIVLGTIGLIILSRRRRAQSSVHLSEHTSQSTE